MPVEDEELVLASYWDKRYQDAAAAAASEDDQLHEWFRGFDSLRSWLARNLFNVRSPADQGPIILHLGCGDSTVPQNFLTLGYAHQICVDFSSVVIEQMRHRFGSDSDIKWTCADVRNLPFATGSIDVAFDKGTLDAMIHGSPWSPPDVVKENTRKYMNQVARVLKDDGVFLYVTFRQPHFVKPLLNADDLWDLQIENLSDGDGSFDYYGFVLHKKGSSG